jgi:putative transposase
MKDYFTKKLQESTEDVLIHGKEDAIKEIIKIVFETILYAERDEFLQNYVNKNSIQKNKGNGYYPRMLRAVNQYFALKIPRDRYSFFKPVFLEAIEAQEEKTMSLAFELYAQGLSTRKVSRILEKIYGNKISPASISNITKEFIEKRDAWLNRPLQESYYFIVIDAVYIPVRRDNVECEAFYVAIGLREDFRRDILGVYNIPQESASGWESVLQDFKRRGLKHCLMFIADGFSNLEDVISKNFPFSDLQKCLVHKMRNLTFKVRSKDRRAIIEDFHSVFILEDPTYTIEKGIKNLEDFIKKWGKTYHSIRGCFKKEHYQYYFSYLKFPFQIHRMIYTTNWIERLNGEIKATTKTRKSFPNPDSALSLICACLMDFEERVYSYPLTDFLQVQDQLQEMMQDYAQTQLY